MTFTTIDYTTIPNDQLDAFHTADGKLHLFNNFACPFGNRALWTAIETHAPFDVIEVPLKDQPASYGEKFNRYETVPYLLDNGFAVYESSLIAQYLDAKFNDGALHRAKDPQAASIAQLVVAKFEIGALYKYLRTADDKDKQDVVAVLTEIETIYREHAKAFRAQGPYLLGAELSSAEINLGPFLYRFDILFRHYRKFELLAAFPLLHAVLEAIKARPTFKQTVHEPDHYIEQYASRITASP
ncbi:Aste57867_11839 [Aphanomyces stellatus]|uniref:Aste57867_11839 protein n=1 Tax=Aphanomyces stellatus TaxID=120398 RepID=A0A485KU32_9STRA|nr:hypothetical protein As57867_011794 [Aphanomyces stellatus]VFT88694.1 Aste57867_11839 [Aphanomyces stellatus]